MKEMLTRRSAILQLLLGLPAAGAGVNLLSQNRTQVPGMARARSMAPIRFINAAESAGLNFQLENCPTPLKHLIETMAGGVAAFDYDGDGLTDIFFANGAALPSLQKESPKYWNRLFRNEGGMRFKDVTEEAGVAGEGYSMGAAAADYDNDGHVDFFVAGSIAIFSTTIWAMAVSRTSRKRRESRAANGPWRGVGLTTTTTACSIFS